MDYYWQFPFQCTVKRNRLVVCEVWYNPGTATWGLSAAPRSRPALTVKNKARLAAPSARHTFLLSTTAFKWHTHWEWSCSLPPRGCSAFTHTQAAQKSHPCMNTVKKLLYIFTVINRQIGLPVKNCNILMLYNPAQLICLMSWRLRFWDLNTQTSALFWTP